MCIVSYYGLITPSIFTTLDVIPLQTLSLYYTKRYLYNHISGFVCISSVTRLIKISIKSEYGAVT